MKILYDGSSSHPVGICLKGNFPRVAISFPKPLWVLLRFREVSLQAQVYLDAPVSTHAEGAGALVHRNEMGIGMAVGVDTVV